jgi:hypothetical protein
MHDEGGKDTEDSKIKENKKKPKEAVTFRKETKDLSFHLRTEHPAYHQHLSRAGDTDIELPCTGVHHITLFQVGISWRPFYYNKITFLGTINPRRTAVTN